MADRFRERSGPEVVGEGGLMVHFDSCTNAGPKGSQDSVVQFTYGVKVRDTVLLTVPTESGLNRRPEIVAGSSTT